MNAFDLLKNCPFCGGVNLSSRNDGTRPYWIGCDVCGAEGPSSGSFKGARVAWNRRHDETPSEFERLIGKENSHV